MTQYARLYGGSLYDLAAEENLTDAIGEQLKEIRDGVQHPERIGICLDTCHVFAAGYDIVHNLDGVL